MTPASSGRICSPDSVGLTPRTNWNQRGRKMMAPKKADRGQEGGRDGDRVVAVAEELERHDGLRGAPLDEQEDRRPRRRRRGGSRRPRTRSTSADLLVGQAQEQEDDGHREDDGAQVVEVAGRRLAVDRGQVAVDDDEADRADGQVDEEDPVPAEVVRQPAAQQRTDDRGDAEDGAEETLVAAALTRREEVADDRQRDREDGARRRRPGCRGRG